MLSDLEIALKELTVILLYLSRFKNKQHNHEIVDLSWKGYDFKVINELDADDYIYQTSRRSKSVVITESGIKLAQDLLKKYGIEDWNDNTD